MKYQLVIVDVIFLYLGDQVHLEFGKGEISRVNEKLLCWGGFTSTVGINFRLLKTIYIAHAYW